MPKSYVPDAGDIVWLQFDPQAGREQAGHRPALVLSPAAYNVKTNLMLCCPLDGTDTKAKAIAKPLKLSVRGTGGEHTPIVNGVVDISPSARFIIKESEVITALYLGIKNLKEAEDQA